VGQQHYLRRFLSLHSGEFVAAMMLTVSARKRQLLEKMAADDIKAGLPLSFLGDIIKRRKLT
jgi:hypothetical protein